MDKERRGLKNNNLLITPQVIRGDKNSIISSLIMNATIPRN
jgi:hypothetical protein